MLCYQITLYFCPKIDLIRLFLLSLIPFTFNCNLLGKTKSRKMYFSRLRKKKKKKLWRFNTFKKKRGYWDLRGGNFNCIFLTWKWNAKNGFCIFGLILLLLFLSTQNGWDGEKLSGKCEMCISTDFIKLYFEVERFWF